MNLPGGMPARTFLASYWQREPLLVRSAFPELSLPLTADELAGLAVEPEVESRLILENDGGQPWVLRQGPFTSDTFADLPARQWTLLVQAIDLWVPGCADLFDAFSFLPRWRFDDLMVSYAAPGGSVGPHYDQYDVFLIQLDGVREWRVSTSVNEQTPRVPDTPLDILAEFSTEQHWQLYPGDMLYIPPGVGHWGIAETAGMTCSVGCRAPTLAEAVQDLASMLTEQRDIAFYRDPDQFVSAREIDPAFITQVKQLLLSHLDDDALLADWFARFVTAPKYPELTEITGEQRRAQINGSDYLNGERIVPGQD